MVRGASVLCKLGSSHLKLRKHAVVDPFGNSRDIFSSESRKTDNNVTRTPLVPQNNIGPWSHATPFFFFLYKHAFLWQRHSGIKKKKKRNDAYLTCLPAIACGVCSPGGGRTQVDGVRFTSAFNPFPKTSNVIAFLVSWSKINALPRFATQMWEVLLV